MTPINCDVHIFWYVLLDLYSVVLKFECAGKVHM